MIPTICYVLVHFKYCTNTVKGASHVLFLNILGIKQILAINDTTSVQIYFPNEKLQFLLLSVIYKVMYNKL